MGRLVALALLALVLVTADAANVRRTLVQNVDGTFDEAYPTGNKNPQVATLSCDNSAQPHPTGEIVSAAYSHNVRQYLSGSAAGSATLALATVSGDNAAANGFAISGDNLVNAGVDADLPGSGVLRVTATTGGNTVNCGALNWQYSAAPGTDVTAPTIPTKVTATGITGGIRIAGDGPTDPCTAVDCTGVEDVQIEFASSIVATVPVAAGLQYDFGLTNVGTISPAPSATLSGSTFDITARGALEQTTSHSMGFANAAHTGAGVLTACVAATDDTADYSKAFLAVTGGTASTDQIFDIDVVHGDSFGYAYLQVARRLTVGATRAVIAQVTPVTFPVGLRLSWTAGLTFTAEYSAGCGNTYSTVASDTVAMPSTLRIGAACVSTDAATNATCHFTQVSGNNTSWTYDYSTALSGNIRVRSRDLQASPNASAYTSTIAGVPGASATTMKWEPGYFALINPTVGNGTSQALIDAQLTAIDTEICPNAAWRGAQIFMYWGGYEGPTLGDYSRGHAFVDTLLSHLAACNKVLMLHVAHVVFGGTSPSDLRYWFPAYLLGAVNGGTDTAGTYGVTYFTVNGDGYNARTWQAATMDRAIALEQDICARYESNPALYMLTSSETSVNQINGSDGYSASNHITQLKRYLTAVRTACPTTHLRLTANFLPGEPATLIDLLDYCEPLKCAVGGPDTFPADVYPITANQVFAGVGGLFGTDDRRGSLLWISEVQEPEMCGYKGAHTPAQLFGVIRNGDTGIPAMRSSHIVVNRVTSTSGTCNTSNNWTAWRTYVESTLSPAGAVMNGTDSTLRTQAFVKANVCPSLMTCDSSP